MSPLVSVVMVNFNGGELVTEAATAVLGSSRPVELLVVDNGSTDGSLAQLQQRLGDDERVRILVNGANLGFATASNRALAQARGDYLLLLNPDCVVRPDTLARVVAVLQGAPEAGMAGCRILNPDGSEQAGCRRSLPTAGSGFRRAFRLDRLPWRRRQDRPVDLNEQPLPDRPVPVEAVSGAFMLLKREALDDVGMLDEGYFLHCEDLDWCRRFADRGWRILFVPDVEVTHYKGTCSRRRPVRVEWHKHRGMLRYYRKFLRQDHSLPFSVLVRTGVLMRFVAVAAVAPLTRLMSRVGKRSIVDG